MLYPIGLAEAHEVPLLPDVERRACALFLTVPVLADLPLHVTREEDLAEAQRAGLLWVARVGDTPIGFALVQPLGEGLHLEELDVLPEHGRRGVGRSLLREVCAHARIQQRPLTLCTFRDVPWNAPFYAGAGFRTLRPEEIGAALAERIAAETRRGLPMDRRVAMKYDGIL